MKNIFLLFAIISALYNAQSHRFIYEYTSSADSLRKDSVTKELMRLNITKDFSEFLSEERARHDSVIMKNISLNKTLDMVFSSNTISSESYTDYVKEETKVYSSKGFIFEDQGKIAAENPSQVARIKREIARNNNQILLNLYQ